MGYKTNEPAYQNTLYYTYFPKSGNVWNVRNANKPAYIRKVSGYKGLIFLGNTKYTINMKYVHKRLLLFIFLSVLCFSCIRKHKIDEKENETFQGGITSNELYNFFEKEVKEYLSQCTGEIKGFYFVFKKTESNDTLFQFSYLGMNDTLFKELGYKGFLDIDNFRVAIYDEENLELLLYKDSIKTEPFIGSEKYNIDDKGNERDISYEKGERAFTMHMLSMGWMKNGVFEVLPASTMARNGWFEYFR